MSRMWHTAEPKDGILRVTIDRVDRPVNVLSRDALEELWDLIEQVKTDSAVSGLVFSSGKRGNFIAGADIDELKELAEADTARELSEFGQRVFAELEALGIPTVALISGACLGGGLEFALSCRYRIADEHPKTLLGLPEVKLGLIPGWGGTVRLPRMVGLTAALPMILTGKMLNGRQARSNGLVHDVVATEALDVVGEKILQTCEKKGTAASLFRSRRKRWLDRGLAKSRWLARMALGRAEKQVQAKTHGHYPAPRAAIDVLRSHCDTPDRADFAAEANAVSRLSQDPVTAECIRLFYLQEQAKKPPAGLEAVVAPDAITQAVVIGAGAMGAGIALLTARRGIWTRMKDVDPLSVARGMQNIRKLLHGDVARRRMTPLQATEALDHLSPTTDYRGLKHADVVIEAVAEDLEIKRQVFRELAAATGPETVLATNTSSLLVEDIARDIPHPERIVGLHFFNPPHQMRLVEVVRTEQTSPEALAKAWALVQRMGKTGVVVGDCAGFLVNRLLLSYMNEAGYLLTEVRDPMEVERAAVAFGMPMGPLELTDLVGLDVAAHVAGNLYAAYGKALQPAPLWAALQEMKAGQEKVGTTLLIKKGRRKRLPRSTRAVIARLRNRFIASGGLPPSPETITQRLIYPVINEAARCLEEGIVERPDDVDLAMVLATGFAPFRGGPLRYADSIGIDRIVETLGRFASAHPRLEPSPALRRLAEEERRAPKAESGVGSDSQPSIRERGLVP